MCYAKPGPRCTKHAYNKLVSAKKRQEKAKEALTEAEQNVMEAGYTPVTVRRLNRARIALEDRAAAVSEANREYSSTPGGLKLLDKAIGAAHSKHDQERVEHLVMLRDDAVKLRSSQMVAYERMMLDKNLEETRQKIGAMNTQRRTVYAAKADLSTEDIRVLVRDEDQEVRAAMFSNPKVNGKVLQAGLFSRNAIIRAAASTNPNTTPEQLRLLVEDDNMLVSAAARTNPNLHRKPKKPSGPAPF